MSLPQRTLTPAQRSLVEASTGMVYRSAQAFVTAHPWQDFDEAVSDGMLGLCLAALDYNPSRSQNFKMYASFRIQFAMKDGIREFNGIQRTDKAREAARSADPNRPTPPRSRVVSLLNDTAAVSIPPGAYGFLQIADTDPPVDDAVCAIDDWKTCLEAIKQLTPNEQYVVVGYHLGGRTLLDLAKALGRTESWASQTRRQAILKLHALVTGEVGMTADQLVARKSTRKRPAAKAA